MSTSSLKALARLANSAGLEGYELVEIVPDAEYRAREGVGTGGVGCDDETRFVSTPDFVVILKFKRP